MSTVDVWIIEVSLDVSRLKYVENAIKSALLVERLGVIIVSTIFNVESQLRHLSTKLLFSGPLIGQPTSYLDHYKNIIMKYYKHPDINHWITLLNSKDMLLPTINESYKDSIDSFAALQYITVVETGATGPFTGSQTILDDLATAATPDNVMSLIKDRNFDLLQASDYSGTSIRCKMLKKYLVDRDNEHIIGMLEDIDILGWIETNGGEQSVKPVAFNRISNKCSQFDANSRSDLVDTLIQNGKTLADLQCSLPSVPLVPQETTSKQSTAPNLNPPIIGRPWHDHNVTRYAYSEIERYLKCPVQLDHSFVPTSQSDWSRMLLTIFIDIGGLREPYMFEYIYSYDHPFNVPKIVSENRELRFMNLDQVDYNPAGGIASVVALLHSNLLDYLSTGTCELKQCTAK
jgi:hypothetical protein